MNSFSIDSCSYHLQTQLNFSNAEADVQYSAWAGFCYVTPLLGGYIADTYLGRYRTILLFCSIYLIGLIMVVIGSVPGQVQASFFFPAIYIIGLGTGGIKPNVSTLGADQFDDRYSQDRKEKESFFSWFVLDFLLSPHDSSHIGNGFQVLLVDQPRFAHQSHPCGLHLPIRYSFFGWT